MLLKDTLQKLGLSDREAKVYRTVLEHKRITPGNIARATDINRPTVYAIAKALVAKGMLTEDLGGKTLYLVPSSPEELKENLKKESAELARREKLLTSVMREVALAGVGHEYAVPRIRFVEENHLEEHLYKRSRAWNESILKYDRIWWGFQDHTFVEHYKDWIDWYWKNTPKEISLRLLSNKSQIEERMKGRHARRTIKFWEKGVNFTATTWVNGDYLILVNTRTRPFYLVEIYDELLAHNMREIFKNIWEMV